MGHAAPPRAPASAPESRYEVLLRQAGLPAVLKRLWRPASLCLQLRETDSFVPLRVASWFILLMLPLLGGCAGFAVVEKSTTPGSATTKPVTSKRTILGASFLKDTSADSLHHERDHAGNETFDLGKYKGTSKEELLEKFLEKIP